MHQKESLCLKQFTSWIQEKESRQTGSAKKSEDTPLETAIASNPHLPTAKLPLAKVSAQQLHLKCFYQSKLFSPLPLIQSLWFYLSFSLVLENFVCYFVLSILTVSSYLHSPYFCFFFPRLWGPRFQQPKLQICPDKKWTSPSIISPGPVVICVSSTDSG